MAISFQRGMCRIRQKDIVGLKNTHIIGLKEKVLLLFKDQKLIHRSLPPGVGRREETPAWSNNGYYLDRKSFPKDMQTSCGNSVYSSGNELHHRLRLESK